MIFRGSRYEGNYLYYDDKNNSSYLAPLDKPLQINSQDLIYQFEAGDRLDILADRFYGNAQLKWKILLANPNYFTELDIKTGDLISIPNPEREW